MNLRTLMDKKMKLRDLFELDILAADSITVKYIRCYVGQPTKVDVLAVLDDEHGIEDVSDDVLDGYFVSNVIADGFFSMVVHVWPDRDYKKGE